MLVCVLFRPADLILDIIISAHARLKNLKSLRIEFRDKGNYGKSGELTPRNREERKTCSIFTSEA